jgi:alcohol dehydrogenase class IV
MDFEIISPQKVIFGIGSVLKLAQETKPLGKKPLLVIGNSLKNSEHFERIMRSFKDGKTDPIVHIPPSGEPSPSSVDDTAAIAVQHLTDCVIAIGGGSVIDTGKAAAGLATNASGVENYLEGVGTGLKLLNDPLPFIAVPTTAGSGAEATKNSVVSDLGKKYKKSFRDGRLVAKTVIIDPELTLHLPKEETFNGGMDAVCQLVESFVTKKSNDYCRALSAFFIPKAMNALTGLKDDPDDIQLRFDMLKSSLASGIALANSGLGAVHGFASGIGGMFRIPHGLVCAVLLPHVVKLNNERGKNIYEQLAAIMGTDVNGLIDMLFEFNDRLGIPEDFKQFGMSKDQSLEIAERSQGGSMTGNPVELTVEEWRDFISTLI